MAKCPEVFDVNKWDKIHIKFFIKNKANIYVFVTSNPSFESLPFLVPVLLMPNAEDIQFTTGTVTCSMAQDS